MKEEGELKGQGMGEGEGMKSGQVKRGSERERGKEEVTTTTRRALLKIFLLSLSLVLAHL